MYYLLDCEALAYGRCTLRQRQRQHAVFKARIRTFFGDLGRQIARGPGFKPLD